MLRDRSLIPSEAIRLAALGELSIGPRRYGDLANEVRAFTGRIVGPSLDLIGPPIELLKLEGLIEAEAGGPEAMVRITASGRDELRRLLASSVRPAINDLAKLVIALKLRFLHVLPEAERRAQLDMMVEVAEQETVRLADLRQRLGAEVGLLTGWLEVEIRQAEERLAWLRGL
jgi:DNA-binding PadR family transcriptional regulator